VKPEAMVTLFGKPITVVMDDNGGVMFDRKMFIQALTKARAQRIFREMDEKLAFLGEDGVDTLIATGKECVICELLLFDSRTSDELREYAQTWVMAHQLLEAIQ
jgi:hypothetical protein